MHQDGVEYSIRPKISQFLFTNQCTEFTMIGGYWTHIPVIADRGLHAACGVIESMDHIVVHCRSAPMQLIWQLVKDTCAPCKHPMAGDLARYSPRMRVSLSTPSSEPGTEPG